MSKRHGNGPVAYASAAAPPPPTYAPIPLHPSVTLPSSPSLPNLNALPSPSPSPPAASGFALEDGIGFITMAMQSISQDEFSKCFEPKPHSMSFLPSPVYGFYLFGALIRYGVLFPIRLTALFISTCLLIFALPVLALLQSDKLQSLFFLFMAKSWLFCVGGWIRHHGQKPILSQPHIFVANHTTYFDFVLMSSHVKPHGTVAQIHGGLFGYVQRYVLSLMGSMTFQRNEKKDRLALARRLRERCRHNEVAPILIFPEGTCVNNESTVLFHKGAFELGVTVCPVAIRYSKALLDPYWNTREQSFSQHTFYLMTRWAMVADIWWLPPTRIQPDETPIAFAERVKALISDAAGLQNLSWDGYLKNFMAGHEQAKLQRHSQAHYVHSLRQRRVDVSLSDGSASAATSPVLGSEQIVSLPPTAFPLGYRRSKRANSDTLNLARLSEQAMAGPASASAAAPSAGPVFPSWLAEHQLVDIKNELMKHALAEAKVQADTASSSSTLGQVVGSIMAAKEDVVATWKEFTKMRSVVPAVRRIENSAWRLWAKQTRDGGAGGAAGVGGGGSAAVGSPPKLEPIADASPEGLGPVFQTAHAAASSPP